MGQIEELQWKTVRGRVTQLCCIIKLSRGNLTFMKRAPLIAVALAVVYFLLALNAYACLLPIAVGVVMEQGSDFAKPVEKPARPLCYAFKPFGVQPLPPFHPLPDTH